MGRSIPVLFVSTFTFALSYSQSLIKQEYVVGGWIPDLPENFLLQWSPIFEEYLTVTVGILYQPPIRFRLIPVDFSTENRAIDLIKEGKLDFVCEFDIFVAFVPRRAEDFCFLIQTIIQYNLPALMPPLDSLQ